jgi:molybdopterin molybdotransferase
MLPQGADAVVMQEHARVGLGGVAVETRMKPGDNVVAAGADVRAGQTVFARGRRLRSPDLGILAGIGHARVEVTLRPRVAILSTGDEVVAAEDPIGPGKVRDMNGAALAGAVMAAGGEPTVLGVVRDELAPVEEALRRAVETHEMVLVSGGSSVGERDVAVDAIARLGPPGIAVHGISVRPGKPTVLASIGGVPVIGLPGNPVSALVIFDLFARPVLERLLGMNPASRPWDKVRARLVTRLASAGPREDHRRVKLETRADGLWAAPLPAGSQILTSLTEADGIVVVPGDSDGFAAGADVEVRLL